MPGAADSLQERIDGARRADLTHQVYIADVDAELERSGRDQCLQLAPFEPLLGLQASFFGKAPMVCSDILLAQPLG